MLEKHIGIKVTPMVFLPAIFMNCCIISQADNNGKWKMGRGSGGSQITNVARRHHRGKKLPKKEAGTAKDGRCHEHNKWPQLTDTAFSLFILADAVKITPLSTRKLWLCFAKSRKTTGQKKKVTEKPPIEVGGRATNTTPTLWERWSHVFHFHAQST